MEQNHQLAITSIPNATIDPPPSHHDEPKPTLRSSNKKKRHGAMHVLRGAILMMRGGSEKPKALPVDDGSKSVWGKLVGSVRPLHLQSNDDQSPPQRTLKRKPKLSESSSDGGENALTVASDFPAEECLSSGSSSRYASAVGLNELEHGEDNEKQQEEIIVDEMNIDAKAEKFITQFYKQIKMQRLDSMDRRYKEISLRSLGN